LLGTAFDAVLTGAFDAVLAGAFDTVLAGALAGAFDAALTATFAAGFAGLLRGDFEAAADLPTVLVAAAFDAAGLVAGFLAGTDFAVGFVAVFLTAGLVAALLALGAAFVFADLPAPFFLAAALLFAVGALIVAGLPAAAFGAVFFTAGVDFAVDDLAAGFAGVRTGLLGAGLEAALVGTKNLSVGRYERPVSSPTSKLRSEDGHVGLRTVRCHCGTDQRSHRPPV
jgi:hypothetical protein